MAEDYYALLGVEPDASEDAILRAYRARAAEEHPDVSDAPDAEARFQRLSRAKDVLTDAERRREYDRVGHDRFVEGDDGPSGGDGPVDVESRPGSAGPQWGQGPVAGAPGAVDGLVDWLFGGGRGWSLGRDARSPTPERSRRPSPAEVDLRGVVSRRGTAGSRATADDGRERDTADCDRCGGRGTIVHVLDTAGGRHRRLERCEACGGSGAAVT